MLDEDGHVRASIFGLVLHVVCIQSHLDFTFQHFHLVQLKVGQSILKDVLKLVLSFLDEPPEGVFRAVLLWVNDRYLVGVDVGVAELNLALVDHKQDQVVAQGVRPMITFKDAFLDTQLVIVEELLKEACLRVLV